MANKNIFGLPEKRDKTSVKKNPVPAAASANDMFGVKPDLDPEALRKEGMNEFDTWMADVWMENPENDDKPEPTYDEFLADPAKYGASEDTVKQFARYRRGGR